MTTFLYVWLIGVSFLDITLIGPAVNRTDLLQTRGRLIATLSTLTGLIVGSIGRLAEGNNLPPTAAFGVVLIDLGLIAYTVFLPERGVIDFVKRRRRR